MVSLINTIDTGDEDMNYHAVLCSTDGSVKIFEKSSGGIQLAELKGHQGPVWEIAWANPKFGKILASCSYDRKVIVWRKDATNGWRKIYVYQHASSVNSVDFAPAEYGLVLACGCSDGSISVLTCITEYHVWEFKRIIKAHIIGCNTISWSPSTAPGPAFDQRSSSQSTAVKRFVSGGCDNYVKIWREDHGLWVEEHRLETHSDWVRNVAWSPSIGLHRSQIASATHDRNVIIWNSNDFNNWSPTILHRFDGTVWSLSWAITGNILAVVAGDNKVTLWKENIEQQWMCIADVLAVPQQSSSSSEATADQEH